MAQEAGLCREAEAGRTAGPSVRAKTAQQSQELCQARPFVIFDMDGTLVDSMKYWMRLGDEYLAKCGVGKDQMAPLVKEMAEQTISESSAMLVRTFHWDKTPRQVADEINGLMDEHYRKDVQLKPGVKEYLGKMHAAGVHCCVASASDPELVKTCLTRQGVYEDFDFALSSEVYGGKVSPAIYLECAKRFGAQPPDIAVYEDALYAVRTAAYAHFFTVGILDEWAKEDWDTIRRLSDVTVSDYRELL